MKRIICAFLLLTLLLAVAGCNGETTTSNTTTTANSNTTTQNTDNNLVTKEVFEKYVTNFGFLTDENLNFSLTVYEDDEDYASEIIKKDGNAIHYEMIISETSFLRYLDFSELKTNNRFVGYMYFSNDDHKWYKQYSSEDVTDIADIIRMYARPSFEDATYENGKYTYAYKDEYDYDCTMTFKFENNVLVQYEAFEEGDRVVNGVFSDINSTRVTLPEAFFIDDMPMTAMLDYIKDFTKSLESYNKITVKAYEVNDCFASVRFDYEVICEDEEENDDIEAIKDGIYNLFVKREYENIVEITKFDEVKQDYLWAAQFKNGNKNYIIFELDEDDPYDITFSIANEAGADMFGFRVYLEEALKDFNFERDNNYVISNNECLITKYTFQIHDDDKEDVLGFVKTVLEDYNGLEWEHTEAEILPIYSHSEIYSNENMSVKFVVGDADSSGLYHFELYCCVTLDGTSPYNLLAYGYEPLMP